MTIRRVRARVPNPSPCPSPSPSPNHNPNPNTEPNQDGVDLTTREMMVTNGANQAYAACLLATCDPGDEVVLFQPYYFSHLVAAQLLGLSVLIEP